MENKIQGGEIMANWDKAMLGGDAFTLKRSVNQVMGILSDELFRRQYDSLYFLFQSGSRKIEAWGNCLEVDDHEMYRKIFAYAIFWMAEKISGKLYRRCLAETGTRGKYEEVNKEIENSKYLNTILDLLEKNGELSQGAMAEYLSVTSNALSNYLRRNEKYGLWDYNRIGKYNYYHLTGEGKGYLAAHRQESIKAECDISTILLYYTECLAEEMEEDVPDIENIVHKMNKKFGGGQAVFGDGADKIAMRRTVRKLNYIVRRNDVINKIHSYDEYGRSAIMSDVDNYIDANYSELLWEEGSVINGNI